MKVRREIASIPVRSAGETWQAIVDLITGSGSVDVDTLNIWMNDTLKSRAPRIGVHDVASPPADDVDDDDSTSVSANALKIDWGVLGRP